MISKNLLKCGLGALCALTFFSSELLVSKEVRELEKLQNIKKESKQTLRKNIATAQHIPLNPSDGGAVGYSTTQSLSGVYTVTADNIFEAYRGTGYVHATDRMWQIFSFWALSTGNLSKYFGDTVDNRNSDMFFRSIAPSNAVMDSYLSDPSGSGIFDRSYNAFTGMLQGINDRIEEVNNSGGTLYPVETAAIQCSGFTFPQITIHDYIRMSIAAGMQLSSTMFGPLEQLLNADVYSKLIFGDAQSSVPGFGFAGISMFNDFYPPQPGPIAQIKTATSAPDNCTCTNASGLLSVQKNGLKKNVNKFKSHADIKLPKLANLIDSIENARKATGLPHLGGSWGVAIAPSKTSSCNATLFGAPQLDHTVPGAVYEVITQIKSKGKCDGNLQFKNQGVAFFGLPAAIIATCQNFDYVFSTSAQVAAVCGRDAVILNPTDIHLDRIEYISGCDLNAPIEVPIYVSNDETSYIFNAFTYTANEQQYTVPVGMRTALGFGSETLVINSLEPLFSQNFQDFFDLCQSASGSQEVSTLNLVFADSLGNIGDVISGCWTQLPAKINRQLPQTNVTDLLALGLPLYPSLDQNPFKVRRDLQDFNSPRGFYTNWNQNYAGCLESVDIGFNTANGSRGQVVDERICQFMRKGKIHSCDYINLMIAIANTQKLSSGFQPTLKSSGDAQSDLWMDYVPLILEALESAPSLTPAQSDALAILSAYKGNFVDGPSQNAILTTLNISDGFMLLAAIESQLKWDLFGSLNGGQFESLFPGSAPKPTSSAPVPQVGYDLNILGNPLLAAIGGGFNGNTNQFDWTQGTSPQTLILNAVETAMANLGSKPWGQGLRAVTSYQSNFGTIPGVPVLNRSAYYKIDVLGRKKFTHQDVAFCGQSGDPASPHFLDQKVNSEEWKLEEINSKSSRYNSKKAATSLDGTRIAYTYSVHPNDTAANNPIDNCSSTVCAH
jgi:acyl-homoserine lactone acylase PvdQ